MLQVVSNEQFKFTMVGRFAGLFFPPKSEIHYIGGSEILPPPLEAAQEQKLLKKMGTPEEGEARSILIEHNLRLVAHIVKKYYAQSVDQDDLISIGTIGLIKGISSFDPAKGARLETYAARCIENTILT